VRSQPTITEGLLHAAADHATRYLETLDDRPVRPTASAAEMLTAFATALDGAPTDPQRVLDELVSTAEPGLMAFNSPRFYGWVIGGTLPAALAADWLTAAWDQPAGLAEPCPAASAAEQVAGEWMREALGLPAGSSFALVTGCQMAHVTALAAARHRVLADAGWDVEADGLVGAPAIRVLAGAERHVTIDRALRLLGLGSRSLVPIDVDERGAMRADALAAALRDGGPTIVCAQAGNVNTGAVDPLEAICDSAREAGAWVHVDGAFGLWAAASPARRALVAGVERAHSWATDAHKWLNVPYDCGVAFVTDAAAHRAAMAFTAAYVEPSLDDTVRNPMDWTPEFSRRARGFAVYAALRSLGHDGLAELTDRLCDCAEHFAQRLANRPGIDVLAAGLNQVLVRFGDDDATTDSVVGALQRDGTSWFSATTWAGRRCMRISVCNWQTTEADVDRSVDAILALV
jgi:glutamate/tyrosine decarboxylase-like PLP-dependent enzyme